MIIIELLFHKIVVGIFEQKLQRDDGTEVMLWDASLNLKYF